MEQVQESTTEPCENRTLEEKLDSEKAKPSVKSVAPGYIPQDASEQLFAKTNIRETKQGFQTHNSYPQTAFSYKQQVHRLTNGGLNVGANDEASRITDLANQAFIMNSAPSSLRAASRMNTYRDSFSEASGSTSYSTADDASGMGAASEIKMGYNMYNAYNSNPYSDISVPLIHQNQAEMIQGSEKAMQPVEANYSNTHIGGGSALQKEIIQFQKAFSNQFANTGSITANLLSSASALIGSKTQIYPTRSSDSLRTSTRSFSLGLGSKENDSSTFTKQFEIVSSQPPSEDFQNGKLKHQAEVGFMQSSRYRDESVVDYSEQQRTNSANYQYSNFSSVQGTGNEPTHSWYQNQGIQTNNENELLNIADSGHNVINALHNNAGSLELLNGKEKIAFVSNGNSIFPSTHALYNQKQELHSKSVTPDIYSSNNEVSFAPRKFIVESAPLDTNRELANQKLGNYNETFLLRDHQNGADNFVNRAKSFVSSDSAFQPSTQHDFVLATESKEVGAYEVATSVTNEDPNSAMQLNYLHSQSRAGKKKNQVESVDPNDQFHSTAAHIPSIQPYKHNKQAMRAAEISALHTTTQSQRPFNQHFSLPEKTQIFLPVQNNGTLINQSAETIHSVAPTYDESDTGVNLHTQSKLLPPIAIPGELQNIAFGNNYESNAMFGKNVTDIIALEQTKVPGKRKPSKTAKVRGRKPTHKGADSLQCPYCTDENACSFKRREHLKRHISSVHIKKKPFQCPKCNKRFTRVDNMRNHVNICKNDAQSG